MLSGVEISTNASGNDVPQVTIRDDASGSPSDATKFELTNPDLPTEDRPDPQDRVFSAPAGSILDPYTTYWVVFEDVADTDEAYFVVLTEEEDEDDDGEDGWSIGNGSKSKEGTGNWTDQDHPFKIKVTGTEVGAAVEFVSNTGAGSPRSVYNIIGNTANQFGQEFTTGSNADGYRLEEVTVILSTAFGSSSHNRYRFSINTEPTDDHFTGEQLYELTRDSSYVVGNNVLKAPNEASLAANTTYLLLLRNTRSGGGTEVTIDGVSSNAEDSGGQPGWSIANGSTTFNTGTETTTDNAFSIFIALSGRVVAKGVTLDTDPDTADVQFDPLSLTEGEGTDEYTVVLDTGTVGRRDGDADGAGWVEHQP